MKLIALLGVLFALTIANCTIENCTNTTKASPECNLKTRSNMKSNKRRTTTEPTDRSFNGYTTFSTPEHGCKHQTFDYVQCVREIKENNRQKHSKLRQFAECVSILEKEKRRCRSHYQ